MVQRLAGAQGVSAYALSREVGIPQPTLSRWLTAASSLPVVKNDDETQPRAKRPDEWSPQQKLAAVMEAAGVSDAELGAWLRRKGLTEEQLRQWRENALSGFKARASRGSRDDRKRVKELERELKRKDRALAETAALLVLQGKMEALWAAEDEATRQSSDEQSSRVSKKPKLRGRS
jgi:hypothetical protein